MEPNETMMWTGPLPPRFADAATEVVEASADWSDPGPLSGWYPLARPSRDGMAFDARLPAGPGRAERRAVARL